MIRILSAIVSMGLPPVGILLFPRGRDYGDGTGRSCYGGLRRHGPFSEPRPTTHQVQRLLVRGLQLSAWVVDSAFSRSEIRSSGCSMPVEYLTSDSGMPISLRSFALDSTWLVVAGGPTVVSTAPRFAARCANCRRGKNDRTASYPPRSEKLSIPPKPRICLLASSC